MNITLEEFLESTRPEANGAIEEMQESYGHFWEQARVLTLTSELVDDFIKISVDYIRDQVRRASADDAYAARIERGRKLLAKIAQKATEHGYTIAPEILQSPLSLAEVVERVGMVEIVGGKVIPT